MNEWICGRVAPQTQIHTKIDYPHHIFIFIMSSASAIATANADHGAGVATTIDANIPQNVFFTRLVRSGSHRAQHVVSSVSLDLAMLL